MYMSHVRPEAAEAGRAHRADIVGLDDDLRSLLELRRMRRCIRNHDAAVAPSNIFGRSVRGRFSVPTYLGSCSSPHEADLVPGGTCQGGVCALKHPLHKAHTYACARMLVHPTSARRTI